MNWYYKGKGLTDDMIPEDAVGFVYIIKQYPSEEYVRIANKGVGMNLPGSIKIYIGKKLLNSTTKSKIGVRALKKQMQETTDKRKIKKVQVKVKDSGWRKYTGSCSELNQAIKEHPELFRKEIIEFCHSKKHMSYTETKHQILHNVLEVDSWNGHIQNWYRKDIIKEQ